MSKNSEAVKSWRYRTKARLVEAMGGKCVCCDYHRCNRALEFHHRNPDEKDSGLGDIRATIRSWKRIVEEAKKCVLVCSVCHAEIHDGIRSVPIDACGFDDKYEEYCKKKIEEFDTCPVCGGLKHTEALTCSRKCGSSRSWSVDWGSVDLPASLKIMSIREFASSMGISKDAVRKRMMKLGLNKDGIIDG